MTKTKHHIVTDANPTLGDYSLMPLINTSTHYIPGDLHTNEVLETQKDTVELTKKLVKLRVRMTALEERLKKQEDTFAKVIGDLVKEFKKEKK